MNESAAESPDVLDAEVAEAARRVTGDSAAELLEWTARPMAHVGIISTTGGLHIVEGRVRSDGAERPWSCVLKVLTRPPQPECYDPASWCYWRREAAFYGSDLPTTLPGPLRAPRPYGVLDRDEEAHVWMEHVAAAAAPWRREDFRRAATAAGSSAGAFLTGRPLPDEPWLARDFLRTLFAEGGFWATTLHPETGETWRSPIAQAFGARTRERVLDFWANRERLLAALEAMPQVLGHGDYYTRNILLPPGGDDVVAIDWGFCGPAPLGADLGDLVSVAAWFCDVEVAELPAIERIAFEGFEAALRAAGWEGDRRLVRLGYAASAAMRLGACMPGWAAWLLAPDRAASSEILFGRPADAVLGVWIALGERFLDLADEARGLARDLRLL